MSKSGPPSALPEQDYDAIEAAVMETARGRWFLAEYARRNRTADTQMLLSAIAKLEMAIGEQASGDSGWGRFQGDLIEMANAIAQTKHEIAAMQTADGSDGRIDEATGELDAIVEATEKATSEILYACEQIQEIAWSAREDGSNPAACDAIDAHVTEIYTACSFQDLTGQRTQKVVKVLRFIENRLNAMMQIWNVDAAHAGVVHEETDQRPDAHLLNGPQLAGKGKSQDEVNSLLEGDGGFDGAGDIDLDDIAFVSAVEAADTFEAVQADIAPQPDVGEQIGANVTDADVAVPSQIQSGNAAAPTPVEKAAYDLTALEQAAENAVGSGEAAQFSAYPRDAAQSLSSSEPDTPAMPMHGEADGANAPDAVDRGTGRVSVPSLHDLAFAPPPAVSAKPDAGYGGMQGVDEAFGAIAAQLERNVATAQPPVATTREPDDASTDPFAGLSAAQRMVLFS